MTERAIFFDRDGTITVEKEYNFNPDALELIPGALEALQLAVANGYRIFVVTNQSGVARGLGSEDDVRRVNRRLEELASAGHIRFDGVFYCPHLPAISGPCTCRKPARGMIDQALAAVDLDLACSFVVGDRLLDMELARNVGAVGVMVLTGYGSVEVGDATDTNCPAEVVPDVLAAVKWIVSRG